MSTSAILHERTQALWEAFQVVKERCSLTTSVEARDLLWREMDAILRELERLVRTERRRKPPAPPAAGS